MAPLYSVGQLYPGSRMAALAKQPGGPGTVVTSPAEGNGGGLPWAQLPQEHTGRFIAGCSHSLCSWDVYRVDNGGGHAVALLCCPLDGYIQRILDPYDLIYDIVQNPILVA